MEVALAVTAHDPEGRSAPGVRRTAEKLEELFSAVAANVTEPTSETLVATLEAAGAVVTTHAVGNVAGRSRRDAVALALRSGADRILYSDLDHLLRWIEREPREVEAIIREPAAADVVVVGRTEAAFSRSPARLRDTEAIVNRVYKLVTGRDADLMFAIRLLSRTAAEAIVESCTEDTISNDVEWPLFAELHGYSVEYVAAEGLDYRIIADFDGAPDALDLDPDAWIYRVELAAQHLGVMRRLTPSLAVDE